MPAGPLSSAGKPPPTHSGPAHSSSRLGHGPDPACPFPWGRIVCPSTLPAHRARKRKDRIPPEWPQTHSVLASIGCWSALPDSGRQSGIQLRVLQQIQDNQTVTSSGSAPAWARTVRSCRTALVQSPTSSPLSLLHPWKDAGSISNCCPSSAWGAEHPLGPLHLLPAGSHAHLSTAGASSHTHPQDHSKSIHDSQDSYSPLLLSNTEQEG